MTAAALEKGGWLCRALLVIQSTQSQHHADHHDAIDSACGYDPGRSLDASAPAFGQATSDDVVVVAVHHNGLGNQLFEYAFGRLLAYGSGSSFGATLIDRLEAPMNTQMPPHSASGWAAFREIFADEVVGTGAVDTCAVLTPTKREYEVNGTLLLAERPADTRRVRLSKQLERVLETMAKETRCLKTIGYWQKYGFYAGMAPLLKAWMPFRPVELSESPGADDVVVHVRLCDGPMHFYKYYAFDNYFAHVFDKLEPPAKHVKVISQCDPRKPGVVKDLVDKLGADVAKPKTRGAVSPDRTAADFLYMTRAKRLVVTESTYSWWAAYLGDAAEVHAPGSGVVPVPYQEPRYVFHDIKDAQYWGRYDHHARKVVYAVTATPKTPASDRDFEDLK